MWLCSLAFLKTSAQLQKVEPTEVIVNVLNTGWSDNPVEFDTVLNASRQSWAFGSPDIVDMFARGHAHMRVHVEHYAAEVRASQSLVCKKL